PTTSPVPARSLPRRKRSRRESASWEHPQFTLFVTLEVIEAATAADAFHRRKIMRLLDQRHPARPLLPQNVLRVGFVPEPLHLLGRVAHVLGEHEVAVVEQSRLRRAIGDATAYDRPVLSLGDIRQQRALRRLGSEEVVAMIQKEEPQVGLEEPADLPR